MALTGAPRGCVANFENSQFIQLSCGSVETIYAKPELQGLPIVANVDFGHTNPMITFPVGGTCEITVSATSQQVMLIEI